jgi:hypothetical protein
LQSILAAIGTGGFLWLLEFIFNRYMKNCTIVF